METAVTWPPAHHQNIIQDPVGRRGAILSTFTTRSTWKRCGTLLVSLPRPQVLILHLYLHTPKSREHLLADVRCPAATPSSFHCWTLKPPPLVKPRSPTTSVQVPQSVCVRSITWSEQAGLPTGHALQCHQTEGRRREMMVLQQKGFVWQTSQPGRGDWGMWWAIVSQEGTRISTSRLQLQSLTCPRIREEHEVSLCSCFYNSYNCFHIWPLDMSGDSSPDMQLPFHTCSVAHSRR